MKHEYYELLIMTTKERMTTIATTGEQLPPEWAKQANVAPDEAIQVIIGPSRDRAASELITLMKEMSEEAISRGLTEERLTELLKDD